MIQIFPYGELKPELDETVFLAPGAKVIGDVKIGKGSSAWYNTVIRGDVHYIRIGEDTNIQDSSMIHVTGVKFPVNIGDRVTIGHSVSLHGCTLEDECLIGIGAVVLDGATVEKHSLVAAGAVVREGSTVPSGKLVAGVPAKVIRDLTPEEIAYFKTSANHYREYSDITRKSLEELVEQTL